MAALWTPAVAPPLAVNQVHVWTARLDPPVSFLDDLWDVLSEQERARAQRFRFKEHSRRFVAAHAALRAVLSRYTDVPEQAIEFQVDRYGKPSLAGESAEIGLNFNLAHSGELAAIAVAASRPLGVDIELLRPMPRAESIVQNYFHPEEEAAIRATAAEQREHIFFRCWTRKEAYIKAAGRGLSMPLDSFCALIPDPLEDWYIADLALPTGYVGAVAAQGAAFELLYRRLHSQPARSM